MGPCPSLTTFITVFLVWLAASAGFQVEVGEVSAKQQGKAQEINI